MQARRTAPRAETWQVVVDGGVVGRTELRETDEEVTVLDVVLDVAREHTEVRQRHLGALRALLDCRVIARGADSWTLQVTGPGDAADLAAAADLETASVRLALDLRADAAGASYGPGVEVRLAPMGAEAFEAFREALTEDYIRERVGSGETEPAARRLVEQQLADLLPDGARSEGQHLFTAWARSGGRDDVVGHLWIALRPGRDDGAEAAPRAFVWSVEVVPEQRRRGYGAGLVLAGARWAREQGADVLGLHVFGHNTAARALYDRLGFEVVDATHRRRVASS